MKRFFVGVLALAACGGGGDEAVATQTSALSTKSYLLLQDHQSGGCDTREYVGDGDWYPQYCKTECNSAATGISSSFAAVGGGCDSVHFDDTWYHTPSYYEFTHMLACNNGSGPSVNVANGYTLHFEASNDQRSPTVGYDWAPTLDKGECDSTHAITAVASDYHWHGNNACGIFGQSSSAYAWGVVGARCSALISPARTYAVATNCAVMDFTNVDAREPNASGDWDSGFLKGECGDGRYIKGIAHGMFGNGSRRVTKILCCSPSYLPIPP
jgi:hypothetical protein